jgi:hypothetical protein
MLEDKIVKLDTYLDSWFRNEHGNNAIRVLIPETWVIYGKKNDEYSITAKKVRHNGAVKAQFDGSDNLSLEDIMEFAIQVIMNNIENESKKNLFQVKLKELADIFDANQLAMLENLVFKFEKPKKEKKTKGDIEEEKIEEVPEEIETEEEIEGKVLAAINESKKKSVKK